MPHRTLRIGIDFDNTLIDYDGVFVAAARERGLIGREIAGSKRAVRDAIRLLPDGELTWDVRKSLWRIVLANYRLDHRCGAFEGQNVERPRTSEKRLGTHKPLSRGLTAVYTQNPRQDVM